jgi:hypothetical protein
MPLSTDNQDYQNPENKQDEKQKDEKGKNKTSTGPEDNLTGMTSDNLKGKHPDPDLDREEDRPADV